MPLKNYQYDSILREYDARQSRARHDLEDRKDALYAQLPELAQIDARLAHNSIECAKRSLKGEPDALTGLKAENEALSARKTALMTAHGYPEDYLTPRYQCPDCKDTGLKDGARCHCFKQAVVDILYSQSNVSNAIRHENFSTFSYDYYSDSYIDEDLQMTPLANIRRVVDTVRKFISDFDRTPGNLLIYGNTGVGKTFLTNCIASELLGSGHTVIYLTAFQLFDILEHYKFDRNNYYGDDRNYDEITNRFSHILDCDLLIIDDLGTELNNSFITSQLYLCINERLLGGKSTVISTNLSFEQLQNNYSERIFSRITSSYTFLKIIGKDIRIQKKLS